MIVITFITFWVVMAIVMIAYELITYTDFGKRKLFKK